MRSSLQRCCVLAPSPAPRGHHRNGRLSCGAWPSLVMRKERIFSFDFVQVADLDEFEPEYRRLATRTPDVILAIGPEIGLKSALGVTQTLPVVMIAIDYDPLARGYVTSLAR